MPESPMTAVVLAGALHIVKADVVQTNVETTMRQLAVMLVIHASEHEETVRGLAVRLGVSKPAITRACDRLVMREMVRRVPDPVDRRSVLITLTPFGRAWIRKLEKACEKVAA